MTLVLDEDGRSELHQAVIKRDLSGVEHICSSNTKVLLMKDPTGLTALHLSCLLGDVEITRKLIEFIPADSTPLSQLCNNTGRTPLHCAIAKQHFILIEVLVKWCPQLINAKDNNGWMVLHVAAAVGAPGSVLRELVRAGADLRETDKEGLTPGVIATQDEHPDTVEAFLALGKEANYAWWKENIGTSEICAVDFVKSQKMHSVYKNFLESI